jgi:hypothetical protein
LRKLKTGNGYVLNVPFLEGPKQNEGIVYEHVELRVILPEGAEYAIMSPSAQTVLISSPQKCPIQHHRPHRKRRNHPPQNIHGHHRPHSPHHQSQQSHRRAPRSRNHHHV